MCVCVCIWACLWPCQSIAPLSSTCTFYLYMAIKSHCTFRFIKHARSIIHTHYTWTPVHYTKRLNIFYFLTAFKYVILDSTICTYYYIYYCRTPLEYCSYIIFTYHNCAKWRTKNCNRCTCLHYIICYVLCIFAYIVQ